MSNVFSDVNDSPTNYPTWTVQSPATGSNQGTVGNAGVSGTVLSAQVAAQAQTSGSALCETCGFCAALSIFHREEVSRYGTQQKILRHGAPMDEES